MRMMSSRSCRLGLIVGAAVRMIPTHGADTNFAGLLANDAQLSKFSELLDRAGMSPSLAQTIFVPTSDALEALRANEDSLWNDYVSKPEYFAHLREVLLWHLVTEGPFLYDEIFDGSREFLENSLYNITIDQRFKKMDNVANTSFLYNVTSSEGVLHALSDVIIPPYMAVNLMEHMLKRDTSAKFSYATMANLALFAGLEDKINAVHENGLTFLVPTDGRFNRENIDVKKLLTEEMKEYTRDFILAHLIRDNYYEAGIFAYNDENNQEQFLVTTELGTHLWVTTTDGYLRFQSRKLLLTDRVARNGIFHVMDLPVYPPFISDFTQFTAVSTSYDTTDCYRFFRLALLSSEEISETYNSSLTMFCPTRQAFSLFNNEDFQRLLEPQWKRHGTEFLLNHITSPALTREELVALAPSTITMLNGEQYELKRSGDVVRIKNTELEQARTEFGDIIALDGFLHIVDSALTPTAVSRSVYDKTNLDPDFSLLTENIDFVQLTDNIDRDIPLTMLAPNNNAFRRVTFATLDGADIIKRHLFSGLFFCDVLANMTEIETVNGEKIGIELRGEPGSGLWGLDEQNLYVGGAYLYNCDIFARNGVLHHVDRVIGLDYDTVTPTMTPAPTVTPQPTIGIPPTAAPQRKPQAKPTAFVPIALPPILPGVVPSAKTDDGPNPTTPPGTSGTSSVQVLATSSILSAAWLLVTMF